jgi:hypothetical protein
MKQSRLTFLKTTDTLDSRGHKGFGLYQCACGSVCELKIYRVDSGNTKSCGCLQKENSKKHGLRKHPLYVVWLNMRQRCNNPKVECYHRYVGRGIKVCERWNDFSNFYNDVVEGYKPGYELDRVENDLGYSPDNVQWIEHIRNGQKRDYCKLDFEKAELIRKSKLSVAELATEFKVSKGSIVNILKNRTWICNR